MSSRIHGERGAILGRDGKRGKPVCHRMRLSIRRGGGLLFQMHVGAQGDGVSPVALPCMQRAIQRGRVERHTVWWAHGLLYVHDADDGRPGAAGKTGQRRHVTWHDWRRGGVGRCAAYGRAGRRHQHRWANGSADQWRVAGDGTSRDRAVAAGCGSLSLYHRRVLLARHWVSVRTASEALQWRTEVSANVDRRVLLHAPQM